MIKSSVSWSIECFKRYLSVFHVRASYFSSRKNKCNNIIALSLTILTISRLLRSLNIGAHHLNCGITAQSVTVKSTAISFI